MSLPTGNDRDRGPRRHRQLRNQVMTYPVSILDTMLVVRILRSTPHPPSTMGRVWLEAATLAHIERALSLVESGRDLEKNQTVPACHVPPPGESRRTTAPGRDTIRTHEGIYIRHGIQKPIGIPTVHSIARHSARAVESSFRLFIMIIYYMQHTSKATGRSCSGRPWRSDRGAPPRATHVWRGTIPSHMLYA